MKDKLTFLYRTLVLVGFAMWQVGCSPYRAAMDVQAAGGVRYKEASVKVIKTCLDELSGGSEDIAAKICREVGLIDHKAEGEKTITILYLTESSEIDGLVSYRISELESWKRSMSLPERKRYTCLKDLPQERSRCGFEDIKLPRAVMKRYAKSSKADGNVRTALVIYSGENEFSVRRENIYNFKTGQQVVSVLDVPQDDPILVQF